MCVCAYVLMLVVKSIYVPYLSHEYEHFFYTNLLVNFRLVSEYSGFLFSFSSERPG